MTLTDSVLQLISEIHIPGFFITTDFLQTGEFLPQGIDFFLKEKHAKKIHSAKKKKIIYQQSGWRIAFTFYPTDRVVDEKYAMKNKMIKKRYDY